MDCRKYNAWISDAAAGELEAANDAELRAHTAQCEDCRLALDRTQKLLAAIDKGIVQLLDAEPSPDLLIRVRQRIAAPALKAGTQRFGPARRLALGAALGILMVLVGIRTISEIRYSRKPALVSSVSGKPAGLDRNFGRLVIAPEVPERRPEARLSSKTAKYFVRKAAVKERRHGNRGQPEVPEVPEVLVEKDEPALVVALCQGLMTGRIDGQSLWKTPPGYKREPDGSLVPTPLEIQPIKIASLDAGRNRDSTGLGTL
jgi:hypothetical protein